MADNRDPRRDDEEQPEQDPMDRERRYEFPEQGSQFPEDPVRDPDVDDDERIDQPEDRPTPHRERTH